ncbi:hypothetical protein SDC9_109447 [bioreactor metagenome]|uniref:Uncharacterized protein n=1 Tax=bioreactor metagenome TaxID=1076179 RepID=A0A645BB76_9ZZZZ
MDGPLKERLVQLFVSQFNTAKITGRNIFIGNGKVFCLPGEAQDGSAFKSVCRIIDFQHQNLVRCICIYILRSTTQQDAH